MIPTVTALTIAGSDPSGGAGIQADMKAMSANGAYAMSVITALTAQSTKGVAGVHAVPVDFVKLQLDTVLDDIAPDATKIGMLATADLARLVGEYLPRLPYTVLDPVMVATSGDPLLGNEAIATVRQLCTVADLITPNLAEAAVLLESDWATNVDEMTEQAFALRELGVKNALVKGGHLDEKACDVFLGEDNSEPHILSAHRIHTKNTHGTGCTLSSSIAALRPRCDSWLEAVTHAKAYLTGAIEQADELGVGHGHGPVHHFYELWNDDMMKDNDVH